MGYPDIEKTLVAHLAVALGVRTLTETPANLVQALPVVRVIRAGGGDDFVSDAPRVDVEIFAANRAAMWTLAEAARDAVHALAGKAVNGVLVDSVRTDTGPVWVDYGNPAISRAVSSYRITLRRH